MEQTHFFASCCYGWGTGDTRQAAIDRMITACGVANLKRIMLNAQKEGEAGCYFWTCEVEGPSDQNYQIEWFAPQGVVKMNACNHFFTYLTAKKHAYTTEEAR